MVKVEITKNGWKNELTLERVQKILNSNTR